MSFFNKLFLSKNLPILILGVLLVGFLLLKMLNFNSEPSTNAETYIPTESQKESCATCHQQNAGFSEFHNPEAIGCVACHLGNGTAQEKDEAHENMVLIPGNLSNADMTCGKCHVNELHKVKHSLMTTNSGIIAIDKFIFGEAGSPDLAYHIKDLQFTAADKHLRDLCANCHLGAEKIEFGAINQLSRGGGCNACHLNYSENAASDLSNYLSSGKKILPKAHPSTDIFVKNEHCFGCHSRSSRISTNYEGWHETLLEDKDILNKEGFRTLEDGRIYIASPDEGAANKARKIVESLTKEVQVGETYLGKVTKLMKFGAFVEILPGKEGLVHVSQLALHRVEKPEDVVKEGDEIMVKVTEIDDKGRINLSRKALLLEKKQ